MSLSGKQWTRVSIHQVMLTWLRAERATNLRTQLLLPEVVWKLAVDPLLDNADLNDPEENRARLRVFLRRHKRRKSESLIKRPAELTLSMA
jgi:hypothetical protein